MSQIHGSQMPLRTDQVVTAVKASEGNPKFTRISDGRSLYLMTRNGRGYWSFLYKENKSLRTKMLGTTADMSPNQARQARERFNVQRRDGIMEERRGIAPGSARAKPAQATGKLFGEVVTDYLSETAANRKGSKEADAYTRTLEGLSTMLVADIDTPDVERHLATYADKPATWKKTRVRIEKILNFAKARGHLTGDNVARWKGLFEHLPRPNVPDAKHHDAMDAADVPKLMRELIALDRPDARALAFTIMTASRASEVIGMRWSEVVGNVWTVPAERMKAEREHSVPLTPAMIKLLGKRGGDGFVFPSRYGDNKPLAHTSMRELLRKLRPVVKVHGMRTTFSTWAAKAGYALELREMALAHAIGDATFRAYNRDQLTELRRPMMQKWTRAIS
jgi:integrase